MIRSTELLLLKTALPLLDSQHFDWLNKPGFSAHKPAVTKYGKLIQAQDELKTFFSTEGIADKNRFADDIIPAEKLRCKHVENATSKSHLKETF